MNNNLVKNLNSREFFKYVLSGIMTAFINIGTFYFLTKVEVDFRISNLAAIVLSKIYAFVSCKYLVFHSKCDSIAEALKEFIKYVLARGFTGCLDYIGVYVAVNVLEMDKMVSKLGIQFVVIMVNYICSKKIVFSEKKG
ncbi:GtrA family protein [bacterium 1xD8-48]|nr:GtrA family protein [bacterium 1xD8-48]